MVFCIIRAAEDGVIVAGVIRHILHAGSAAGRRVHQAVVVHHTIITVVIVVTVLYLLLAVQLQL